jgi:CBS domain containing-hemolysin-like protein
MTVAFILLLILLLSISALLSASETALFSLSQPALKKMQGERHMRWRLVAKLMQRPRDLLVTLLLLNVCANLLVQNTVSSLFGMSSSWLLKVGLPLILTLFFGEILPKSWALFHNRAIAYRMAPSLSRLSRWIRGIRDPLTWITSRISRCLFFYLSEEQEISMAELSHVLHAFRGQQTLSDEERQLIGGLIDLKRLSLKELMRPREEILAYEIEGPIDHLVQLFSIEKVAKVPVCQGSLDKVIGILGVETFFTHQSQIQRGQDLLPWIKAPLYVPETTRGWALLNSFKEQGEELALVIDEYGALSGLITQEDLIEKVVGEIQDGRDNSSLYRRASDRSIIANGKLEISEFEHIFQTSLTTHEHYVTVGGWLIEQLEDIPQTGTRYLYPPFLFYVLDAQPNRVRQVYVRKLEL